MRAWNAPSLPQLADRGPVPALFDSRTRDLQRLPEGRRKSVAVRDIGWMVQELRVSLFAQRLGTARTVSPQRIKKAIDKLK